jgi:hypothetical protein
MMKTGKRFFAKHSKSSAFVLSLAIHAGLIMLAVFLVAITVLIPPDVEFRTVAYEHPRLPPRRFPKPHQPRQQASLRPMIAQIAVNPSKVKFASVHIPAISAMMTAPIQTDHTDELGELGFNLGANINFFNRLNQKSEKVVFLVHAGPATTTGRNKEQSRSSRMTFYTIRKRLNEMVEQLPRYTLFNVAYYWAGHTTPISPKMLHATPENKQQLVEWGSSLNPLDMTKTYGSGFEQGFRQRLANLAWPERLDEDLPPFGPQWYYNYTCSPEIAQFYKGFRGGFENWARALCFAMEQKPDTIFILCTGYVIGNDDAGMMANSYKKIARAIYGPDKKKYPTVNVVVLNKVGNDVENAEKNRDRFSPITAAFRGKSGIIEDIKDVMTDDELERLKDRS